MSSLLTDAGGKAKFKPKLSANASSSVGFYDDRLVIWLLVKDPNLLIFNLLIVTAFASLLL